MQSKSAGKAIFVLLILLAFVLAPQSQAQEASVITGLVEGVTGGITDQLTGYALTALGLNSQSSTQTAILNQLTQINNELDTISAQLSQISSEITTQTCVQALNSSSVTNALTSIETVSNDYTALLQAGENPSGTVTQADINNVLSEIANGPGGGLPSISASLVAINIALQSTNNDGIIGTCQNAVKTASSVPATGSFGADATFYKDPINLLQYFANYQTVAAMLQVEYYNYQAYLSSPYYSAGTTSNGLPASQAALVCQNPTGQTATECGFARNVLEQLYVYLQNQYSANGVPYSTYDSSGNLQTGLYLAGNNTNYLFVASLEEFTNAEDIPQNNCSTPLTSSSNTCGLAFTSKPFTTPFWSYPNNLFSAAYQYETGWAPATAVMWRAVTNAWANGSKTQTLADGLTALGFQNAANKIILTQTEYTATPSLEADFGPGAVFGSSGMTALCFMDTNQLRSTALQPWCYNGSFNSVNYGQSTDLISLTKDEYVEYDKSNCDAVIAQSNLESGASNACFYGFSSCNNVLLTSDVNYNNNTGKSNTCPNPGIWTNGIQPAWLPYSDGSIQEGGYMWPAIDVSNPTCGTNLAFGLLQPAVVRTTTNFLGVPTMCGADFDAYFSGVAPRNPYRQIVVTSSAFSGTGNGSATLGPITIQMQDASSGTAVALTSTSDTIVDLASTSLTGTFSLTADGSAVTSVTIPAGTSTASFYYGDSTAGTPQVSADPGTMVPGIQNETITTETPSSDEVTGHGAECGLEQDQRHDQDPRADQPAQRHQATRRLTDHSERAGGRRGCRRTGAQERWHHAAISARALCYQGKH